jgi:Glycosyl transferase family 2
MPTLACVTMVYNEQIFLPSWLAYYGAQTGLQHCYVVDHGSTDGSTADLGDANRIFVPRSPFDDAKRADFISGLCSSLLQYYDFVIYSDVDEIIVADPLKWRSLPDCLGAAGEVTTCIGFNVIHKTPSETTLRWDAPILAQRRYVMPLAAMCKPLLSRRPIHWTPGFHSYDGPLNFNALFLFHLAYADTELALQRQAKRRTHEFSSERMASHHRIADATLSEWMRNWSLMPVHDDTTFDAQCPQLPRLLNAVTESDRRRDHEQYGFSPNITIHELWRIPDRFQSAF